MMMGDTGKKSLTSWQVSFERRDSKICTIHCALYGGGQMEYWHGEVPTEKPIAGLGGRIDWGIDIGFLQ